MEVKCVECGRVGKGIKDKHGEGYRPYRHNNEVGEVCSGRFLLGDPVKNVLVVGADAGVVGITEKVSVKSIVPEIPKDHTEKVIDDALKKEIERMDKEKKHKERKIHVGKETKHQKKDGDIVCKKCGEPFDPYKKIEYRKNGGSALSTCTHCGFVTKVHKIETSKEYVPVHDGWRRKSPKKKISKKERRRQRKLDAAARLEQARKDNFAFKLEA